jgi:hypothetical protein
VKKATAPEKQRTTIYLTEELRWELRRVMAERRVESDTKAIEEAVRQWIKGPGRPQLVPQPAATRESSAWQRALGFIIASGHHDAISAVQQNIVLFYGIAGGNTEDLPPVDEPVRPFQSRDAKLGKKKA